MTDAGSLTAATAEISRGRDFSVAGRVVIITGSGQGIGREYAREFAAAGAIPVVTDVNAEGVQRVAKEIDDAGHTALAVPADVSDPDVVESLVKTVLDEHGRIDALINNAAIFSTLKMRRFDKIPYEEWERVLKVNVTGCYLMARAVLPAMLEAQWGRIINIMSGAVPLGVPNYLHYVTSKSALIGMSNALARELGSDGITVNAVQPGGTFTEIERETVTAEGKARVIANQCIHRAGVPMDLVGLLIFLATEASGFITGQTIACDGGLTHR
jgi:3-oxoacyl-[acyl-carrier protein] reductase